MTAVSRSIQYLRATCGKYLLLLASASAGVCQLSGGEQIHGSGKFILNEGPIYSDTGVFIGNSTGHVTGGYVGTLTIDAGGILSIGTIVADHLPHSISASAVNGSVIKSPDRAVYDFDTRVSLTAVPDAGYVFEKWTLNDEDYGTAPVISLRAVRDYALVAHFVPMTRIIGIDAGFLAWDLQIVGGISSASFSIHNTGNTPLTVSGIVYPPGFSGNWTGTVSPGSSEAITVNFAPKSPGTYSGNITVNSDATAGTSTTSVSAAAEYGHTLTATSRFGPLNTVPESRTYWQGSVVNLQARPVDGYVFIDWTENGRPVSTRPNFDLSMTGTHELWANYLPESRTLKIVGATRFGVTKIGSSRRGVVFIKNTGTLPVHVMGLRLQPVGPGGRAFKGNWSGCIEPNSTQPVEITFRPYRKQPCQVRFAAIATDLSAMPNEVVLKGSGQ